MELSVNYIWKWQVITEHLEIPFQSSEQQFSTVRMISEEAILIFSEIMESSSPLQELLQEQAKTNTRAYLKEVSLEHLDNDVVKYLKLSIWPLNFFMK